MVALPVSDTALVLLGLLVLFAAEFGATIALTDGHFYYSLDDPYIHLAVSEQIRALSYGLNPGELSTPSSSLLWPILLAVTAGTPIHESTPLVLNVSAAVLTAWLLLRLVRRIVGAGSTWLNVLTVLMLMICFNLVGVAFTGMEHSAHVAAALAVGVGLVESVDRPSPWWLYLAITLNPLLRYEGLAVAFAAVVALVIRHILLRGRRTIEILHVYALMIFAAHAVAGRAGWFGRYELYVYAAVIPVVAHLFRSVIVGVWQRREASRKVLASGAIVLAAVTIGYIKVTATTPLAARNVSLQQAQMARFAADYWPDPVAVNDIGLVSYRDDDYVLDLWGLANAEARRARRGGVYPSDAAADPSGAEAVVANVNANSEEGPSVEGSQWMRRLADQHSVTAAMIYSSWFTHVPPQWKPVAHLYFTGPNINSGGRVVTFYATSSKEEDRLRAALEQFKVTLPSGATLVPIRAAS